MKGILFKPDMIKAIIEGRKTVTRRIIKPQPDNDIVGFVKFGDEFLPEKMFGEQRFSVGDIQTRIKPRYQVGETVYVKEAFILENTYEYHEESLAPTDRPFQRHGDNESGHYFLIPRYKLSEPDILITDGEDEKGRLMTHWQSPLFMPAWAARLFIKITANAPERLQEITEEDDVKEGTPINDFFPANTALIAGLTTVDYYAELWDSINPDYPFSSNPWVFRYEFEVLKESDAKE